MFLKAMGPLEKPDIDDMIFGNAGSGPSQR